MDTMSPEPMTLAAGISPTLRARLDAKMAALGLNPDALPDLPDSRTESLEDFAARKAIQASNRNSRWVARLPEDYAQATLNDLAPEHRDPIQAWLLNGTGNLVLAGAIGTGKTHAAYAIGNHSVAGGSWVEAWTIHHLLKAMLPEQDATAYATAAKVSLLVLDDLGASKATDWAKDQIMALADDRRNAHLRTIITTNMTQTDLADVWSGQTIDRLTGGATVVKFTGESRRKAAW